MFPLFMVMLAALLVQALDLTASAMPDSLLLPLSFPAPSVLLP